MTLPRANGHSFDADLRCSHCREPYGVTTRCAGKDPVIPGALCSRNTCRGSLRTARDGRVYCAACREREAA